MKQISKNVVKLFYIKKIKGKYIGSGFFTICFQHKLNKDKVYCITTDKNKLKWYKANDIFNYKLLKVDKINDFKLYHYELHKFKKLNKRDKKYLKEEVVNLFNYFYRNSNKPISLSFIKFINKGIGNEFIKQQLNKVVEVYSNSKAELDIHVNQFAKIKKHKYILLDPVYVKNG